MIELLDRIPHAVAAFFTGLVITAFLILALAMVQLSSAPATDLHLWLHSLIYGELGAIGGYIVAHLKAPS